MNPFCRLAFLGLTPFALLRPVTASIFEPTGDDTGIGLIQSTAVVFPSAMLSNGVSTGEARVVVCVDASGRLTDSLTVGYTDPAFAEAADHALKHWTYEPARVHGLARASRAEVLFTFRNNGDVTVQSSPALGIEKRLITLLQEHYAYHAWQLRDLDRIPTPLHVVRPALKTGSPKHGSSRAVNVEFYIDPEGIVRAAAIDPKETDDVYAAAAVAAVEQWRFAPPLRKGRPVLVVATQIFNFLPQP